MTTGKWTAIGVLGLAVAAVAYLRLHPPAGISGTLSLNWDEPAPGQQALLNELRTCLNVDRAKSVPAEVVSACLQKDVESLVGIERGALFRALDMPTGCRHGIGTNEPWDQGCQDAIDVYYHFYPPCSPGGPGPPAILRIVFARERVYQARWEKHKVWNGPPGCIP